MAQPENSAHRNEVFRALFKGKQVNNRILFKNPGYRGVEVLPYPKHVVEMVKEIDDNIRKLKHDHKYAIYAGREVKPKVDEIKQAGDQLDQSRTAVKNF